MERQVTDWEKIYVNRVADKQLISRIYKETLTFNQTRKKWAKGLTDSSPRRYMNAALITM